MWAVRCGCMHATTMPHPTFARRWFHRHTGAHVCLQPCWLLCRSTGWCAEENERQAAMHPQRSCTSRIEPRQVWPRSDPVPVPHHTGSMSLTASSSGCVFKCTGVSTAWLPDIWPSSAECRPIASGRRPWSHLASTSLQALQHGCFCCLSAALWAGRLCKTVGQTLYFKYRYGVNHLVLILQFPFATMSHL